MHIRYTLNDAGLRIEMVAEYGWRQPAVVTETYTYDPLCRLTGVADSEGFLAAYEYDAAGNRTRWQANDDQTTQTPGDGFDVTYDYDAADRLLRAGDTHYAYDVNGNRVNANWPGPPGPNTQGVDYTYDREDRLVVAQERNRLAHEIHDTLGHTLTALDVQLELLARLPPGQAKQRQGKLYHCRLAWPCPSTGPRKRR